MKNTIRVAVATFLLTVGTAAFACDYPQRADVPNGATATKEQMLAGQASVKEFVAAMEAYLACIEKDEEDTIASMPELSEEELATRNAALTKKYNAAVEEMELVAAQFNEEVRAYKAKSEE